MEGQELAARHIALREQAGLTQEQEAKIAGVSPTTISGIESGKITRPHLKTLLKIARALGVNVGELRESGKAEASPSSVQPPLNGFEEERGAAWEAAVENARRLREGGQERMAELLWAWRESEEREEPDDARRGHLDAMGALLQQAYDAETALLEAADSDLPGTRFDLTGARVREQWPELLEADRFYIELLNLVRGAELWVRTDGGPPAEQAGTRVQRDPRPLAVEKPKAA